jgi:hypothetical protein
MRIEIKNWLGVVVLLCVGFILGRATVLPDVNASAENLDIGRYQLLIGEIETSTLLPDGEAVTGYPYKTLFRIDTITGDVSIYEINVSIPTEKDSLVNIVPMWRSVTSASLLSPTTKWEDFLESVKEK